MNLGDELAVITSVANEDPNTFKRGLIGWCEWSNTQPNLEAIALDPSWDTHRMVAELDDDRVQLLAKILKEIQTMPLKGYQLSFIPDVEPYYIENPAFIETSSGTATVTRTEMIGPSQVIWADYGSGLSHPHQPEDVKVVHPPEQSRSLPTVGEMVECELHLFGDRVWVPGEVIQCDSHLGVKWQHKKCSGVVLMTRGLTWRYPPEQTLDAADAAAPPTTKSRKRRRYPGKGKASGWIETRKTNRKREQPSEYLVYRWQDGDGKHSRYLRGAIAPVVRQMIAGGASVAQILERLDQ